MTMRLFAFKARIKSIHRDMHLKNPKYYSLLRIRSNHQSYQPCEVVYVPDCRLCPRAADTYKYAPKTSQSKTQQFSSSVATTALFIYCFDIDSSGLNRITVKPPSIHTL